MNTKLSTVTYKSNFRRGCNSVKGRNQIGQLVNSCFVIMPFSAIFDSEYSYVIKPAIEATGLSSVRADQIYSKPQIMADIWKALRSSRFVIAEL